MKQIELSSPKACAPAASAQSLSHAATWRWRLAYAGLFGVCLFAFFWRSGSVGPIDLDDALYISCARQMVLTGDYITPRLNSRPLERPQETTAPFFEKPILVYWLSAFCMRLFGITTWAARLPAALAALATTWIIVLAGTRWFGRRAGWLAGLIYALAPMTVVDARLTTTDGLLTLWFTLALLAFWNVYADSPASESPPSFSEVSQGGAAEPLRRDPCSGAARKGAGGLGFWATCALAVLTKGAIGLLLPLVVMGVFLLVKRLAVRFGGKRGWRVRLLLQLARVEEWWPVVRRLRPLLGLLLFLAIALPWHLLVSRAGGIDADGFNFFQQYIVRQHIQRFRGGDVVHNMPMLTYFGYFLLGFFPWSCFAPAAFRLPRATEPSSPQRFLLVWFWTIFVFFSLGAAKLPNYIVPAYPAAAWLIGSWLDRVLQMAEERGARSLRRGALGVVALAALLFVAAIVAPRFARKASPINADTELLILTLAVLFLVGGAGAWVCFLMGRTQLVWRQAGVGVCAAMMLAIVGFVGLFGYAVIEHDILWPYQQLADLANGDAAQGIPILYYHIIPRRPSMLYYARYSPLEQKEEPLLPRLRSLFQSGDKAVDVITSRGTLHKSLQGELFLAPDLTARILASNGKGDYGWVLLRVEAGPRTAVRPSPSLPARVPL